MGKIRNIMWTGYNGWVRGAERPEGRKIFKKSVEIGHVKLKNVITFHKLNEMFVRIWIKKIRIIENSIRPEGSGGGAPRR